MCLPSATALRPLAASSRTWDTEADGNEISARVVGARAHPDGTLTPSRRHRSTDSRPREHGRSRVHLRLRRRPGPWKVGDLHTKRRTHAADPGAPRRRLFGVPLLTDDRSSSRPQPASFACAPDRVAPGVDRSTSRAHRTRPRPPVADALPHRQYGGIPSLRRRRTALGRHTTRTDRRGYNPAPAPSRIRWITPRPPSSPPTERSRGGRGLHHRVHAAPIGGWLSG